LSHLAPLSLQGDSSEAALSEEDTYRDIEVIGPPGTANYLIGALGFTGAKLRSRIVVSELCDAERPLQRLSGTIHVQSIKPNRDGIWELGPAESCKDGATLFAARIRHTTPCWGFLLVEPDVPGNIDADKMQALGIPPSPLYRTLKQGGALVLKDGTVVKPEDVVTPPMRGRRIAILGDTDSAFQSAHLFRGVDALVHDCTLPPQMEDHKSRATGHSGPRIAGEFARHIGAGHLFLSHIGRRIGFLRGADMLRRAAAETMRSGNVTVANDFDVFSVNPPNEVDELGVVTKRATRANLVVADGDINELSDAPADAAAAASPHAEQQQ
jgi:ribonuclease BN (tRNA processing enzyme)